MSNVFEAGKILACMTSNIPGTPASVTVSFDHVSVGYMWPDYHSNGSNIH